MMGLQAIFLSGTCDCSRLGVSQTNFVSRTYGGPSLANCIFDFNAPG
jgi:hypothetical protein